MIHRILRQPPLLINDLDSNRALLNLNPTIYYISPGSGVFGLLYFSNCGTAVLSSLDAHLRLYRPHVFMCILRRLM